MKINIFIIWINLFFFQDDTFSIQSYMECTELSQKYIDDVMRINSIEKIMIYYLINGPTPVRQERYKNYLYDQYRNLKEFQKKYSKNKISDNEEKYMENYLNNFIALYKIRASYILGILKSRKAKQALIEAQTKATTEKWRPDIINAINKAIAEIDKK